MQKEKNSLWIRTSFYTTSAEVLRELYVLAGWRTRKKSAAAVVYSEPDLIRCISRLLKVSAPSWCCLYHHVMIL